MPEHMTEIKKELENFLKKFEEYDRHISNGMSSHEDAFEEIRNDLKNQISYYDGFLKGIASQEVSFESDNDDPIF